MHVETSKDLQTSLKKGRKEAKCGYLKLNWSQEAMSEQKSERK